MSCDARGAADVLQAEDNPEYLWNNLCNAHRSIRTEHSICSEGHAHLLSKVQARTCVEAGTQVRVDAPWASRIDLVGIREIGRVHVCLSETIEDDVARNDGHW